MLKMNSPVNIYLSGVDSMAYSTIADQRYDRIKDKSTFWRNM